MTEDPQAHPASEFPPEQIQAVQAAYAFLRAFDQCCGILATADIFSARRGRLKQHVNLFGPRLSAEEVRVWMQAWNQEAYEACAALGDWMDIHPGTSATLAAEDPFQTLLQLVGITEIQPPAHSPLLIDEHRVLGTVPSAGPADAPSQVAGVRRRGFRRGNQILRLADVHIFEQPILTPAAAPQRSARPVLITLLLAGVVLMLAFFLWKVNLRKPSQPGVGPGVGAIAPPISSPGPGSVSPAEPGHPPPSPQRVTIDLFMVEPTQVKSGQPVTVKWKVSNASAVRITPWPGSVEAEGATRFVPSADTEKIVLDARGPGENNSATAQVPIEFLRVAPAAIEFWPDRDQISIGESVTLHWSAPGAASVRILPELPGFDPSRSKGEISVTPNRNTEYTLTASGSDGTSSKLLTVRVVPHIAVFEPSVKQTEQCKTVVLRWTVEGASVISIQPDIGVVRGPYQVVWPLRTTTYKLTAEGPGGSATKETTVAVAPGPIQLCGPR